MTYYTDEAWMDQYTSDDSPIPCLERLVRMELQAKAIASMIDAMFEDAERLHHILGDSDDEAYGTLRAMEVETEDMIRLLVRARDEAEGRMSDMLDVPEEGEA